SRRRHTRLVSDWSSDVCSSDLSHRNDESSCRLPGSIDTRQVPCPARVHSCSPAILIWCNMQECGGVHLWRSSTCLAKAIRRFRRSEERRVGEEGRSGGGAWDV